MEKASNSLPSIENHYSDCLKKEKIPDGLLVDIKDYLANLRTALDYLWHKIPNIHGDYFPVANSKADLAPKVSGIDTQIAVIVESFQDYDSNSWIRCFNLFRNKNVHLTLVPQTRKTTNEFSVKKAGSNETIATFRGCTFGGTGNHISMLGVPMPIDLGTQFPKDVQGLDIDRKIWVDFLFDGTSISPNFPVGVSALPFLKQSLAKVQDILNTVEQKL